MPRRWPRALLSVALLGAAASVLLVVPVVAVLASGPSSREPGEAERAPQGAGGHHAGGHHAVTGVGEPDPAQIDAIRAAMARYADIDVARAEGWVQEHADTPEVGAHFARVEDVEDTEDIDDASDTGEAVEPSGTGSGLDLAEPDYLMYSQLGRPDWQLVAVAYVVDAATSPDPPTGLRGAAYHEHRWTCIVDGEELDEDDIGPVSREDCRAMDGEWSPGGVWMTHVWLVDNPDGVFAATNPSLV